MGDKIEIKTAERIKYEAYEAIDYLMAIVKECTNRYVSRRYIDEKVERAMWAVEFIRNVTEEGKEWD